MTYQDLFSGQLANPSADLAFDAKRTILKLCAALDTAQSVTPPAALVPHVLARLDALGCGGIGAVRALIATDYSGSR